MDDEKWQIYFDRLTALARKKLREIPKQLKDEQDIACSAPSRASFGVWTATAHALFARTTSTTGRSWRRSLLGNAWTCSSISKARKRDVAKMTDAELDEITRDEPGPGSVAEQQEGRRRLLDLLKDDRAARIAEWKMERFTNQEVAEKLDTTERTVEREIKAIKVAWDKVRESDLGRGKRITVAACGSVCSSTCSRCLQPIAGHAMDELLALGGHG